VSREDGALTLGVVCEDLQPEERYTLTPEVAREDPEPKVRNLRDDFKSESKLCASANNIGSHKAEALKGMSKARVATGRVPIHFPIVKKPEMENWKMFNRSQFEAMLTLGKGADNYIVCHKVETQKDMGKTMGAKPNDQGCPTDDRLCDFLAS
jgi:hypothetical protein